MFICDLNNKAILLPRAKNADLSFEATPEQGLNNNSVELKIKMYINEQLTTYKKNVNQRVPLEESWRSMLSNDELKDLLLRVIGQEEYQQLMIVLNHKEKTVALI